ncbi:carbohydrate kinase family protein [Thioclava atlantica]|nr:PfkB family carbohydrate kinase [Thioclava atlantica]
MTRPLATVGNVNVDFILGPLAPWPKPGSEVLCARDELRVGGAAGNVAQAWRGMGRPFQIAANAGSDKFGDWLCEEFGPLAARWPRTTGSTTVSVGLIHPNDERTFLTTAGHLPALDWPQVDAMLDWEALRGGIVMLCGSFLTDALCSDYEALFAKARRFGISVALDTGWPPEGWSDAVLARVRDWIAQSDIVLFNEAEATSFTGLADPLEAATALSSLQPEAGIAVVKIGPKGAIARAGDTTHRAAAPAVRVRDTIGAGDVFNAAFLVALADGRAVGEALGSAVGCASRAISTEPRQYLLQEAPEVQA